jgi:cytochrome c peroxidase
VVDPVDRLRHAPIVRVAVNLRAVSSLPVARRIARLTIAGLLAVGTSLALTACALRTAEPAPTLPVADRSFFGAAPMNEQLRALDALGLPPGDARAALGRRLFFDQRLSRNGTVACATCHDATTGFTDRRKVSVGIGGRRGQRNAPTVMNAALLTSQFWDGRAATLAEQAGMPILNPIEMGFATEQALVDRLAAIPSYAQEFRAAYGREPNYADLTDAIVAFERTLIFLDAPFDRWLAGDASALSAAAQRGYALFTGRAQCSTCHPLDVAGALGTDHLFHDVGVAARNANLAALAAELEQPLAHAGAATAVLDDLAIAHDASELGRFLVTRDPADAGSFKTPSLRNVGLTAPYLHDGSLLTLWDAVAWFDERFATPPLTAAETDDLVAFLFSLTDVRLAAQNASAYTRQRAIFE